MESGVHSNSVPRRCDDAENGTQGESTEKIRTPALRTEKYVALEATPRNLRYYDSGALPPFRVFLSIVLSIALCLGAKRNNLN